MKIYRPHQFAEKLGVSVSTLRHWDFEGRLIAKRTKTKRYYTDDDCRLRRNIPQAQRKKVVYCRVSRAGQKDDLQSQITAMQTFCLGAGVPIDEWMGDIGSGLNFKRKHFLALMEQIENNEISYLYIAHKDRLGRFGFDYFFEFAKRHDC